MKDITITPKQIALKDTMFHLKEAILTLARVEQLLNHIIEHDEGGEAKTKEEEDDFELHMKALKARKPEKEKEKTDAKISTKQKSQ